MSTLPNSARSYRPASAELRLLQSVTASLNRFPDLLRIVRDTYRRSAHPKHLEPAVVEWVAQYVRFFPNKPLGMLDDSHGRAFLSHLARARRASVTEQNEALRSITFLHREVLHQSDFTLDDDAYVKGWSLSRRANPDEGDASFWELDE